MNKERAAVIICITMMIFVAGAILVFDFLQAAKPQSLVTTFISDPKTARAFTWYSDNPKDAAILQVKEGENSKGWDAEDVRTITGSTSSIEIGEHKVKAVHKVAVTGLEPGKTYMYRVGNGKARGWSETSLFQTEEASGQSFTFINVTDSQGITEQDFTLWGKTVQKAMDVFPGAEFIVHNGDFTEKPLDEKAWGYLFAKASPWITRLPLMPVVGNHDEADGNTERFVSHFYVPDNGAEGAASGTTYYFEYGPVRFIMLNSESENEEQTDWLRETLESNKLPWTIVSMHRGPYGGNSYKKLKAWTELFDEYKVDLVLQGHNHEYSRSFPLRHDQAVGDGSNRVRQHEGTVYVVTNTSGPKFNEKKPDQFYHQVHFQNGKQMFAGITASEAALVYRAYDTDGILLDEFSINR